jgi:23S rRNA pseudouridine2605 synthase
MPGKSDQQEDGNRIAKVMARAGLCSRREAEAWIAAGRVSVNGAVITSPALDIGPNDKVEVDGQPMPERERTRLFLYNKPRGLVTTTTDPQKRPTIFDALPKNLPRLISVGRLDINSEGLLLLTNDGSLARALELPQTGWLRRYRVRALGRVAQGSLDQLRGGITVEGIHYGPVEATVDREQGANTWLTVGIREGKNREVRNVLGALGLKVNRLIRVSFGPFELGVLPESGVEEIRTRDLREALGEHVLKEANVDLTGPTIERDTPRAGSSFPRIDSRGRDRTIERPVRNRPSRYDRPQADTPGRSERPERKFDERKRDDKAAGDRKFGGKKFGDKKFSDSKTGERLTGNEAIVGGERVPVKRRLMKHHSDTHAWRGGDAPLRRTYRGKPHKMEKPTGAKKEDVVADRKGRKIHVERYGEKKPEPVVEPRRGGRSRFNDRGADRGKERGGDRGKERTYGRERGNDRGKERADAPDSRPPRPRQRRSFDRRSGPRPSRPLPKE